ncbi:MAG: helix-turn-helix domain-containing protein [Ruminiclostridium sp.]|nr:helix-turn-helix domain-containing protein [Ruminiclostridium sp.]
MTAREKATIITKITEWLEHELHTDDAVPTPPPVTESEQPTELLTLKECTELVKGLSEHTVRQLAVQGIIPSIRTGTGRSSKILINKAALLNYVSGTGINNTPST